MEIDYDVDVVQLKKLSLLGGKGGPIKYCTRL